jgi:hypothetical protein
MSDTDHAIPNSIDIPIGGAQTGFAPSPHGWGAPDALEPQRPTIVVEQSVAAKAEAPPPAQQDLRYHLARIGPLSVLRLSALFSVGVLLVALAGVTILYSFLDGIGVLKSIEHLVNSSGLGHRFQFQLGWILTHVLWVGSVMAIAGSLLATCLALFYNAVGELGGGLDVSFEPAERGDRAHKGGSAHGDGRRLWSRMAARRPLQVGVMRDESEGNGSLPDASGF